MALALCAFASGTRFCFPVSIFCCPVRTPYGKKWSFPSSSLQVSVAPLPAPLTPCLLSSVWVAASCLALVRALAAFGLAPSPRSLLPWFAIWYSFSSVGHLFSPHWPAICLPYCGPSARAAALRPAYVPPGPASLLFQVSFVRVLPAPPLTPLFFRFSFLLPISPGSFIVSFSTLHWLMCF